MKTTAATSLRRIEIGNIIKRIDLFMLMQSITSLTFFTVVLILPLVAVISRAFTYGDVISLQWFYSILTDRYFISLTPTGGKLFNVFGDVMYLWGLDYGVILNSIIVAAIVTLLCSIIGIITAFIMARYNFPGKNIFRVAIVVPMLATPFVNAYVLGKLFHPRNGFLNIIFYEVLHLSLIHI